MENTQVGPFRIIKRLGTSRRQQVFHAHQEVQNRDVVLKFISMPPAIQWAEALDKIERETAELRKLKHDNLVQIYGVGVHKEESKVFFATELVQGEPLSSILARRGRLAPDLVVEYGQQIAEALEYIHGHDLVHSKLTPEKIIITPDHKVKVSDLRLNRARKHRWDATRKRDLEIAAYMSPEQFDEGATEKSDFYSLGVILFELLTGKLPYEPENLGRMRKTKKEVKAPSVAEQVMNCPIWLDKIVTQMVQADPRQRPHSAKAIKFAFEEIRKMDSTRKSAASQVAGSFNPLNAGVDKTAARKALGKKTAKDVKDPTPFWQKTPFLVVALIGMVSLLTWAAWPKSNEAILQEAELHLASKDPEQWLQAAVDTKPLMAVTDEVVSDRAAGVYFDAKEKVLEMSGRSGVKPRATNLYATNIKAYIDATQLFLAGEHGAAKAEFERLVQEVDPQGDQRYVHSAAAKQLQLLASVSSLPEDPETLMAMIDEYDDETDKLKLMQGEKVLNKITKQFGRSRKYIEICKAAQEQLQEVQSRLREEANTSPNAPASE